MNKKRKCKGNSACRRNIYVEVKPEKNQDAYAKEEKETQHQALFHFQDPQGYTALHHAVLIQEPKCAFGLSTEARAEIVA